MIRRDRNKPLIIITTIVIAVLEVLSCNAMFQRGYREGQLDAQEGRYHWIILNDKIIEVKGETP